MKLVIAILSISLFISCNSSKEKKEKPVKNQTNLKIRDRDGNVVQHKPAKNVDEQGNCINTKRTNCNVTPENFERLEMGMDIDEVRKILGSTNELQRMKNTGLPDSLAFNLAKSWFYSLESNTGSKKNHLITCYFNYRKLVYKQID